MAKNAKTNIFLFIPVFLPAPPAAFLGEANGGIEGINKAVNTIDITTKA